MKLVLLYAYEFSICQLKSFLKSFRDKQIFNEIDLENKKPRGTGAGRGIGKSIAEALARDGIEVLCE